MNQEKYTERAQGMIQSAQMLSLREGNQQLTPYHLLKVILDDAEGLAATLLHHASANSRSLLAATEGALAKLPKVSGDTGGVYLSQDLAKVFEFAEKAATTATENTPKGK